MKRPLKAEETRLWAMVARTVRPAPGKSHPELDLDHPREAKKSKRAQPQPLTPAKAGAQTDRQRAEKLQLDPRLRGDERSDRAIRTAQDKLSPHPIEPLRKRRLTRERDEIEARLDLHGLDQDRARAALHAFLFRAHAQGLRAVLVITGKGTLGDGVLRRRTPDWLAEPAVRPIIAGVSQAARHHGGEGALYIALKRRNA